MIVLIGISNLLITTIKPIYSRYLRGIIHSVLKSVGPKKLPINIDKTRYGKKIIKLNPSSLLRYKIRKNFSFIKEEEKN